MFFFFIFFCRNMFLNLFKKVNILSAKPLLLILNMTSQETDNNPLFSLLQHTVDINDNKQ